MTLRRTSCALAALLSGCATTAPSARPQGGSCAEAHARYQHPLLAPLASEHLVYRELEFDVEGQQPEVLKAFLAAPLETFIHTGTAKVAAVDHTEPLTPERFPTVGSVRLVCLRDGGMAEETVLSVTDRRLVYLVTYEMAEAEPVHHAIGSFTFAPDGARTHVTWRYSFALRTDRLPGALGGLGRELFRTTYLEKDYADFMRSIAADITAWAAQRTSGAPRSAR